MNKEQVSDALRNYHWMVNEIMRSRKFLEDVGAGGLVAQSGIESVMPGTPYKVSDPVATEVIRREKKSSWILKLEKKVSYIQERICLIQDEREKVVLECLLDGLSVVAISKHMGLSRRHVTRIKDDIVCRMSHLSHELSDAARCG
jgi:DNA-binding NarL/FixJ family response regulator